MTNMTKALALAIAPVAGRYHVYHQPQFTTEEESSSIIYTPPSAEDGKPAQKGEICDMNDGQWTKVRFFVYDL